ncbi:MAG TPA: septal ring lytic transglycosylase RlpA family protein [Solirubrobacterales bacterium]|nr:septal ring lytic transglycosylase RlpA family protein [Solirubrobacterales bacterium]
MRKLLPAVAAATALSIGLAPAMAQTGGHHHHERSRSHVSLHLSTHSVLKGNGLAVRGKVRPSGRHRIKVVFRGAGGGVRRLRTKANGTFAVRWVPERIGSYAVRVYSVHDRRTSGSVSPARKLTTYRLAGASYYGPGLWGNGVACGGTLLPGTMGVAHKTLPCGTKVKLRYHGRSVTVPVIDRGPYVAGRDYDLTEAVKQKLGFPGVGTVLASR